MAVVGEGRVGIDAERHLRLAELDRLAGKVLCPQELALLLGLPEQDRTAWFLRAWVRKEAVLKLTGYGLALPLRAIDARSDGPMSVTSEGQPLGWSVQLTDLPAVQGHTAALATTGHIGSVRWFAAALGDHRPGR
jgi:4'-phosphopantetheinyl transferase